MHKKEVYKQRLLEILVLNDAIRKPVAFSSWAALSPNQSQMENTLITCKSLNASENQ